MQKDTTREQRTEESKLDVRTDDGNCREEQAQTRKDKDLKEEFHKEFHKADRSDKKQYVAMIAVNTLYLETDMEKHSFPKVSELRRLFQPQIDMLKDT